MSARFVRKCVEYPDGSGRWVVYDAQNYAKQVSYKWETYTDRLSSGIMAERECARLNEAATRYEVRDRPSCTASVDAGKLEVFDTVEGVPVCVYPYSGTSDRSHGFNEWCKERDRLNDKAVEEARRYSKGVAERLRIRQQMVNAVARAVDNKIIFPFYEKRRMELTWEKFPEDDPFGVKPFMQSEPKKEEAVDVKTKAKKPRKKLSLWCALVVDSLRPLDSPFVGSGRADGSNSCWIGTDRDQVVGHAIEQARVWGPRYTVLVGNASSRAKKPTEFTVVPLEV